MSTIPDATNSAVIVIDVQNAVVAHAYERDVVVGRIAALVEQARAADVPVVWVQHNDDELVADTDAWQIVPELVPADGEPIVQKRYRDSFEDTDMAEVLAARHVGRIIVTGAQTDFCVRSTIHGALTRGYDTVLVADAHTTEDLSEWGAPTPEAVIAHTNLYWKGQSAPGRTADVVTSNEVTFA